MTLFYSDAKVGKIFVFIRYKWNYINLIYKLIQSFLIFPIKNRDFKNLNPIAIGCRGDSCLGQCNWSNTGIQSVLNNKASITGSLIRYIFPLTRTKNINTDN